MWQFWPHLVRQLVDARGALPSLWNLVSIPFEAPGRRTSIMLQYYYSNLFDSITISHATCKILHLLDNLQHHCFFECQKPKTSQVTISVFVYCFVHLWISTQLNPAWWSLWADLVSGTRMYNPNFGPAAKAPSPLGWQSHWPWHGPWSSEYSPC